VKRKHWVIVANGSMARILLSSADDKKHWTEKECLLNPEVRLHGTDLDEQRFTVDYKLNQRHLPG